VTKSAVGTDDGTNSTLTITGETHVDGTETVDGTVTHETVGTETIKVDGTETMYNMLFRGGGCI